MTTTDHIGILGIDASYNSTGLCFRFMENGKEKVIMYRLHPSEDKKKNSAHIRSITYEKINTETKVYEYDDLGKIENCKRIVNKIKYLMTMFEKEHGVLAWDIRIEGNVMNAFKGGLLRVVDMVNLTGIIKATVMGSKKCVGSVYAIMELKKLFTGRATLPKVLNKETGKKETVGNPKTMMVDHFAKLYPDFDMRGKVDDVIDAYALSKVPLKNKEQKIKKLTDYISSLSGN